MGTAGQSVHESIEGLSSGELQLFARTRSMDAKSSDFLPVSSQCVSEPVSLKALKLRSVPQVGIPLTGAILKEFSPVPKCRAVFSYKP